MKRWIHKTMAAVLAASLLAGQALPAGAAERIAPVQTETLKIATLSDTHYLSPTMIKDTEDFTEHLNSDRKMFVESEAFLNALLNTVKQDDPDVLLISGDLTKDGEKEGHEALAEILEDFENETGTEVYITPGNHDLNNSNGMNFNTEDGTAVPAGRTTQEDFKEIYGELVYDDNTLIDVFKPSEGKQGGGLSYAARPKEGFTIISIDSARYSADNTESGTDEHETSGNVGPELEAWVLDQIKEANERGDTVIGLQHHGMVPHFTMEPDILPMYLVNDYERLSEEYADAGMDYIFTGHMHANDIAAVTTEAGNTLYDIETGSVITYPSPARSVTLTRTISEGKVSENMDVKTYTHVGPVTFTNPLTGEQQTIEDISAYGREHGFTNDMLSTTINGFLHDYYDQILEEGGSKAAIESLINSLLGDSLPVDHMTLEQLIDVALPLLLPDADSGESIYYDAGEGGIRADLKVSFLTLSMVIPNDGLKDTLNALLQKLDDEVLANPEVMDTVIENLLISLTSLPVSSDGDEQKTLLDYANYIYQSHLGGEDNEEQPAWVQEAAARIENGDLLGDVLTTVIENVTGLVNQILGNVSLEELLGASGWNNTTKEMAAIDGRTPLIRPTESGKTLFSAALVLLGWKDSNDDGILEIPEGSNPEAGYSVQEFLDKLSGLGLDLDIKELLNNLLLGTPEDPGVIDGEMQGEINSWLLNLVTSMGQDDNWPEDNNTTITNEWKLLTDRTALDEAIAAAEAIDLSRYTEASAQTVTEALNAAKALRLAASQEEMDAAAKALNDAVAVLEEKNEAQNPDGTQKPGDTQKPGHTQPSDGTQKPGGTTAKPGTSGSQAVVKSIQTGDASVVFPFVILALAGGGTAVIVLVNKNRAYNR